MNPFKILITIMCCTVMSYSNAQVERPFRFQIYTGGPSIMKAAFNFSKSFQSEVSYSGKALFGFSADYRILNWLSVGADMSYRYGELNMDIDDSTSYVYLRDKWGIDESMVPNPYGHYRLAIPRLRITVMATAHALRPDSPADLYAQFGLGYNKVHPELTLNGSEIEYFKRIGTFSLPVAYRFSLGYAYHFANHIGIFTEAGIGGPVFSVGISTRF